MAREREGGDSRTLLWIPYRQMVIAAALLLVTVVAPPDQTEIASLECRPRIDPRTILSVEMIAKIEYEMPSWRSLRRF